MQREYAQLKSAIIILFVMVIALSAVCVYLVLNRGHVTEFTTERINITEPDGQLRMVISNRQKQHPGMIRNKMFPAREREAGIIFFNEEGDECGGLIYGGEKNNADMVFSVDQYNNDQIMQLQYGQQNSGTLSRNYGLKLWDRSDEHPTVSVLTRVDSLKALKDSAAYARGMAAMAAAGALGTERLFVGKTNNGETGIFLRDAKGNPRLKICVDSLNRTVVELLNEKGQAMPIH